MGLSSYSTTLFLLRCWLLACMALVTLPIQANDGYAPDTREFTGKNAMRFGSNPILSLEQGGAIEFWIAPAWQADPGYSPVILSNHGEQPIYEIRISGAKDALEIQAGQQFGEIAFDFNDGGMHHVAILDFVDDLYVMIDGAIVGAVAMSFADTPGEELWIGGGNNNASPFVGAIAGIRIWEGAIDIETLADYALKDVRASQDPHPMLDALIGESDFRSDDFVVANTVEVDIDTAATANN